MITLVCYGIIDMLSDFTFFLSFFNEFIGMILEFVDKSF